MYEPKMDGQEYVTITLTRAEYDALVWAIEGYAEGGVGEDGSLERVDLHFAAQKIEAAGRRRPEFTEAAGRVRPSAA